ncbi:MAG: amidohydrolase family protein [Gammaproteobacteria bacterium]
MAFDLVIRGGMVVDGTGLAGYPADVAVQDGRIAAIGRLKERGRREIDAAGQVVTPGFIDGHTHMDAQIFWDRDGSCSSWHGVTSVVMGNCGFSLAPASKDKRLLAVRNLERAEDISRAAMDAGIDWTWESFPEYLDAIDRLPKAINYAANIGHSTLRTWAMGERAFTETAGEDDLRRMQAQIRAAMAAGAMGFTTSRSDSHETADNRPVASRIAAWEEVRALVGAMSDTGGVFELAQSAAMFAPDPQLRRAEQERLAALAVDTGVAVSFGLIPGFAPAAMWREALQMMEGAARRGGRMFGQTHSRGVSTVLSFAAHLPFDRLAEWQELRALPLAEQARRLRDPALRARLVRAANEGDYGTAIGAEARRPHWGRLFVFDRPLPPFRAVAEVAAERGVDPVDAMIDLALESEMQALFLQPLRDYADDDLIELMKHPRCVMTFSDSGAHVSQIMDASIQSYLFAWWVRERQVIRLEDAVRMVTLAPAVAWGFADRGVVREGMVADLNVFDPDRITPQVPVLSADLPAGGKRLVSRADGIRATLVAGEVIAENGRSTGATPGRLLRRAGARVRGGSAAA